MPTEKDYNKRKEDYDERELSNSENYDRSFVTLSTFIFGFSLIATSYITANNAGICYTGVLIASWISISAAIILYIVNFWIAGRALGIDLKRAGQCWEEKDYSVFNKRENWDICRKWINWIVGGLFIFALVSIISFVILNLFRI